MRTVVAVIAALACGLALSACGSSDEGSSSSGASPADRAPDPVPDVTLTANDREVWAPLPPDRSAIPTLLYHGIGGEADFSDPEDAAYRVSPEDFAKQMTMMHRAGYQTIDLETFVRFARGDRVQLPGRPVLLTFDDARLDSWTGADGILRKLGFEAVLFVDVGRVSDGDAEYMTWEELKTAQSSGRWKPQLHSGRGHTYIQYGPEEDDTGPFYAYEEPGESFEEWRDRVVSDIDWGEDQLASHFSGYRPLAFAPPYGSYGQDGTNDPRIPDALLGFLTERFDVVFTQDRSGLTVPGDPQPLGRIDVNREVTGGELHAMLTGSD